jgi:hypothetical protein
MPGMASNRLMLSTAMLAMFGWAHVATADAQQPLGKAANNAIYAQTLVNETLAKHPELVVIGLHAKRPGARKSTMIATNLDRIGKADDADDLAVSRERKTILAPDLKDPTRYEVAVPLQDATGKVIGSLSTVFKYRTGDDELKMYAVAVSIRDAIAQNTPYLAALFKPAH